ncbi:adenosine kinase [Amycolatopsis albispora]|uniref:Carbohydrate kinase n=1 Tax=Amycolatopsis albispora TaxID=1804986 RepID=A0A344L329_9PSEU|nr:adenosine kinase [Amycolatopsis albispora]AXB42453.1 carbohydrate kinase [Amycolatopsis albispora]
MGDATGELDVLGFGNAIVDVFSQEDDEFILSRGLPKGGMTLIDPEQAEALYADMGPGIEMSGGSCANTMACIASFGGSAAFIGKVRDDQLGATFEHDIRAVGVHFRTPRATTGAATARSLILVSADGQRTMNTYLGACVELGREDVDESLVARSKVTYIEGYLWDPPRAKDAIRHAIAVAHDAGRKVALSLSDTFCVERHLEEFRHLVENEVDILFANEHEIKTLYPADRIEDAVAGLRGRESVVAVTRSAKGSVVFSGDTRHEVPAEPVEQVVDTTGAGDAYAAGFLYGITHGYELPECARLGSVAASEIISHIGSRPQVQLAELRG